MTIKKHDLGKVLAAIFIDAESKRLKNMGIPEFHAGKAFAVQEICEELGVDLAEYLRCNTQHWTE